MPTESLEERLASVGDLVTWTDEDGEHSGYYAFTLRNRPDVAMGCIWGHDRRDHFVPRDQLTVTGHVG